MSAKQPEALRLAALIEQPEILAALYWGSAHAAPIPGEIAAELRRLHAVTADMLQALRRAVLALAFAAESSPAMADDYKAVSAAIERATGGQ